MKLVFALAVGMLSGTATADEGMWLPEQVPGIASAWTERGLEISPDELADPLGDPLGSIVSLGFCSASFVSPDGLIATNHHCVEGYLQYLSNAEQNYHLNGFVSATQEQEANVGPTARLRVVESITDVTRDVMRGVSSRTSDKSRYDKMALAKKRLEAKCERKPNRRCRVVSHFGGSQYRLVEALELQDVRIVYAPPMSLGQFGGDIDNWMWPRHSADFAFIRAYVAPDGSSAPYSEDNVPYRPSHHLTVSPDSVAPGDFVMVAGYPGRTERHRLAVELAHHTEWYLPTRHALMEEFYDILASHAEADPEAEARLGSAMSSFANGIKNMEGMMEAFARRDLLADKKAEEAAFVAWVGADAERSSKLDGVYDQLQAALTAQAERDRQALMMRYVYGVADLTSVAHRALRLSAERKKRDLDRRPGYQERDMPRMKASFERLDRSLWLPADREMLAAALAHYQAAPEGDRVASLDTLLEQEGGVEAFLERLFDAPALANLETRLSLLDKSESELRGMDDPWMRFAVALEDHYGPLRDEEDARSGEMQRLRSQWMAAKRSWFDADGRVMADDANSTLRITLGHVKGYAPQDGLVATPRTTLAGLAAKVGDAPFDAPEDVVARTSSGPTSRWAVPELGDVPVNHLSTLDITGGNSGSAVMDGQGRFVGLAFDGNWESIASDWIWLDEVTRCISVDIRYILWVLEGQPETARILEELGVAAQ